MNRGYIFFLTVFKIHSIPLPQRPCPSYTIYSGNESLREENERKETKMTKMENAAVQELDLAQLENVNGGLVVDRGIWVSCYVVNDRNGHIVDRVFWKSDAKELAALLGFSTKVVSEAKYRKMTWLDGRVWYDGEWIDL